MWLEDTLKLFNVPIDEYIRLIYTQSNILFAKNTKEICMNIDLTKTNSILNGSKTNYTKTLLHHLLKIVSNMEDKYTVAT